MTNKVLTGMVFSAVVFALAAPSFAQTAGDDLRNVLQHRYDELHAAVLARDENAIKAIVSPGFQNVKTSGETEDREKFLESIKNTGIEIEKAGKTSVISAHRDGNNVFVEQKYDLDVKKFIQGSFHNLIIEATSSDIWAFDSEDLIFMRSETDEIFVKVDGVLVNHKSAHKT